MKKIIFFFICGILLINLVSADNFKITVYSDDKNFWEEFFGNLFTITTTKNTYNVGERVTFTDKISLVGQCGVGKYINYYWSIKTTSGSVKKSSSGNLLGTGSLTIFFTSIWSTSGVTPGGYIISTNWYCNSKPNISGGTFIDSSTKSITLQKPPSTEPPPEQCTKTCDTGYELINPDSSSCYCEQKFTYDNGVCEIGEKENNPNAVDCQAPDEPDEPSEEQTQYYRFGDNQCSPIVLLPSAKTPNDYLDQTECEKKIIDDTNKTKIDTNGNESDLGGNETINPPDDKKDDIKTDYTGVFIIGGLIIGGYFLYNIQSKKRRK